MASPVGLDATQLMALYDNLTAAAAKDKDVKKLLDKFEKANPTDKKTLAQQLAKKVLLEEVPVPKQAASIEKDYKFTKSSSSRVLKFFRWVFRSSIKKNTNIEASLKKLATSLNNIDIAKEKVSRERTFTQDSTKLSNLTLILKAINDRAHLSVDINLPDGLAEKQAETSSPTAQPVAQSRKAEPLVPSHVEAQPEPQHKVDDTETAEQAAQRAQEQAKKASEVRVLSGASTTVKGTVASITEKLSGSRREGTEQSAEEAAKAKDKELAAKAEAERQAKKRAEEEREAAERAAKEEAQRKAQEQATAQTEPHAEQQAEQQAEAIPEPPGGDVPPPPTFPPPNLSKPPPSFRKQPTAGPGKLAQGPTSMQDELKKRLQGRAIQEKAHEPELKPRQKSPEVGQVKAAPEPQRDVEKIKGEASQIFTKAEELLKGKLAQVTEASLKARLEKFYSGDISYLKERSSGLTKVAKPEDFLERAKKFQEKVGKFAQHREEQAQLLARAAVGSEKKPGPSREGFAALRSQMGSKLKLGVESDKATEKEKEQAKAAKPQVRRLKMPVFETQKQTSEKTGEPSADQEAQSATFDGAPEAPPMGGEQGSSDVPEAPPFDAPSR